MGNSLVVKEYRDDIDKFYDKFLEELKYSFPPSEWIDINQSPPK